MSRGFESSCLPEHVRKLLPYDAKQSLGKLGATLPEINAREAAKAEKDIHKLFSNELLRRGIFAIHSRTDKKTTNGVGLPDFCFVLPPGTPVAIEFKLPGQKLSFAQEACRMDMIENGWIYSICYSFVAAVLVVNHLSKKDPKQ